MNFFKNIFKTLFGKSNKNEPAPFGKSGSVVEPKLDVVHKKDDLSPLEIKGFTSKDAELEKGKTYVEHELGDPEPSLSDDILSVSSPINVSEIETSKIKKNRNKDDSRLFETREYKVHQYLIKYGSIDKETSALLFGVKRLDCMILSLRKKGVNITNKNIELTNENGEKRKVNNYVLVNSDGAN